ncbi:cytochrome c biogenesis protein ResB [Priestia endophytica]|uniref:Cytochrome c biogenesis protein n=1 Tax=Priestia endophytica DSM 13796 TaxID=1121089 RepID=A0A1I6BV60_9BACI|nr:cytochrome c biogenesis protein ResB [Priestia endophytica]KYG30803.1 cytochrome C biogenesis protein [Priestia endophytica]MBG9811105.1 cytochrome C biogenesis protein [Priestia endophytica]SFQ84774.1 cytochrome c biogenesis protein [Priestia endophytica DSM 13796]
MKEVKCDCGHINPVGTILCESCGKPVGQNNESKSKKLLDMRYDGSARRSQTYNKTIIDKIWNFFSSVKVGIWLIVVTLIASALGTIFPQEMYIPQTVTPEEFYKDEYGVFGQLYYQFGFHNLYGSWWYMILIASIGISLVICSLDRVIPLYRALKKQGVTRHETFMRRQRLFSETTGDLSQDVEVIKEKLKKKKYNIREGNGNLFAEKGRFSRWGPYVNHIGLIIFLLGAMLRFVPGMYVDEVLWIREGETAVIPGTDGKYYLKNEQFLMDVYTKDNADDVFDKAITRVGDGSIVKTFQTNAVLYERKGEIVHGKEPELAKVKEKKIKVNQPLKHDNYSLYQFRYKLNELNKMKFSLINKDTKKSFGEVTIDLLEPKKSYDLGNGYRVGVVRYLPDFYFNSEGLPDTKTKSPDNPAFLFKMITPDKPEGERSFVAIQKTIEANEDNQYKMQFEGVETKNLSALTVRKDMTLWILGVGGAIFMIGVIQGMYWAHRRIWLQSKDGKILLAGHTNKNWYGLKSEISQIVANTPIVEPVDQKGTEDK